MSSLVMVTTNMLPLNLTEENNSDIQASVLIEGWIWKSPPITKLKSKNDWRKRYFKLLAIEKVETFSLILNGSKKKTKEMEKAYCSYCLAYWKSQNPSLLKPLRK